MQSAAGLVSLFEKQLAQFAAHQFRAIHQFRQIRQVKSDISANDLILHIDFSENYASKYSDETQAVHFGHRHQIVIHQVSYTMDKPPQCFVTLSDDNRKTADAVAAHINAYLAEFQQHQFRKVAY